MSPTQPSGALIIERSTNGTTWTPVGSTTPLSGSTGTFYESEGNFCIIDEEMASEVISTDNNSVTGNVWYRAQVTNEDRFHSLSSIDIHDLSILSIEDLS